MYINTKFCSPNYSKRLNSIRFIILHYTEMGFDEAIHKLCDTEARVSAHYIIKADGEIFKLVDEKYTAWHAGLSSWHQFNKLNESSIGIELDNLGYGYYPMVQMQSCVLLCKALVKKYNILRQNIIAHSDIAPDRKIDPGPFFMWSHLAENDLGIWHDIEIKNEGEVIFTFGDQNIKDLQNRLKKLGYAINITGIFDMQTNYVIRSFQSHFYPALIKKLGKQKYYNNNQLYEWCTNSEILLLHILKKLSLD